MNRCVCINTLRLSKWNISELQKQNLQYHDNVINSREKNFKVKPAHVVNSH